MAECKFVHSSQKEMAGITDVPANRTDDRIKNLRNLLTYFLQPKVVKPVWKDFFFMAWSFFSCGTVRQICSSLYLYPRKQQAERDGKDGKSATGI